MDEWMDVLSLDLMFLFVLMQQLMCLCEEKKKLFSFVSLFCSPPPAAVFLFQFTDQ